MSPSDKAVSNNLPIELEQDVGFLFLANFVHQVVNPVNGVIGTLDNITDGTYPKEVVSQKINACRAQLEQCVTLIRNLAYLSDFFFETSAKAALRPPQKEAVTSVLPQVVIEALQFYQIAAAKRKIALELGDRPPIQYRLSVRPELLKQVFINIFDNWVKYGDADQTISVTTCVTAKKMLTITIAGHSMGFDGSDSERIFELGFRAHQAKSALAQGSGIGLHICKKIIEQALDGTIRAEHNKKARLTTFRISIPKAKWQL